MIALVVTIKIKPGHKDAFMTSMFDDARGSNDDEPAVCGLTSYRITRTPTRSISTKCIRTKRPWTPIAKRPTTPSGGRR